MSTWPIIAFSVIQIKMGHINMAHYCILHNANKNGPSDTWPIIRFSVMLKKWSQGELSQSIMGQIKIDVYKKNEKWAKSTWPKKKCIKK